MTDVTAADDEAGAEGQEGTGKKKLAGKKLVLFVVLPLLLLLVGGGVGAYFFLFAGDEAAETAAAEQAEPEKSAVFYDLPEMLVNLDTGGKRSSYLKLRVALELEKPEDVAKLETVLPRVIDNFQVYLRELRHEDLKGSSGLMRLKEELLIRVNVASGTVPIKDVLFKEMLVQ